MDDGEGGGEHVISSPLDLSPFIMEEVFLRLKLLSYTANYCAPRDIPPFHKYQFSTVGGSNQFSSFVGIVTWLLQEARRKFAVDRFDDPTTVTSKLVGELRAMGAGQDVLDFQPLKLRTGSGEAPCKILLFCADAALAAKGFKFVKAQQTEEPLVWRPCVCAHARVLKKACDHPSHSNILLAG